MERFDKHSLRRSKFLEVEVATDVNRRVTSIVPILNYLPRHVYMYTCIETAHVKRKKKKRKKECRETVESYCNVQV